MRHTLSQHDERIPNARSPNARIPNPKPRIPLTARAVFLVYTALTLVLTWPLATGLTRHVPGDFGDPLFTSWVLAWDATHLGRGWWNANIFAPRPLALAYSEHFLPQALQAAPFYLATRNPLLGYNIVFLSTFALSGLGMFLFARELTRSAPAAFVAGLAYAFAPYRIASIPHLQVLSSAWMPFVLYGLRRHFETRRISAPRRRGGGVDSPEPVVRLLPALLQPDRGRTHRVGAVDAPAVARSARDRAHRRHVRRRRRRDRAVPAAVPGAAHARLPAALARRDAKVLGGRLRVPDGRSESPSSGDRRCRHGRGPKASCFQG